MGYFDDSWAAPDAARGAVAVGDLAHSAWAERSAVLLLRHWCLGGGGDSGAQRGAKTGISPLLADAAIMQACHGLCGVLIRHARRPLLYHAAQCSCIGADEACFANLVCAAGSGARDDAMAFAMLLAHPQAALLILPPAQKLGLLLHRMALHQRPDGKLGAPPHALH